MVDTRFEEDTHFEEDTRFEEDMHFEEDTHFAEGSPLEEGTHQREGIRLREDTLLKKGTQVVHVLVGDIHVIQAVASAQRQIQQDLKVSLCQWTHCCCPFHLPSYFNLKLLHREHYHCKNDWKSKAKVIRQKQT